MKNDRELGNLRDARRWWRENHSRFDPTFREFVDRHTT